MALDLRRYSDRAFLLRTDSNTSTRCRLTNGDILFLRTRHPFLVAQAIAHILRGSMNRAVLSLLVAALLLALLWMVAASLGRIATVDAMLEYFRSRFAGDVPQSDEKKSESSSRGVSVSPVAAAELPSGRGDRRYGLGFAGALFLASFASSLTHPRPGLAFLVFLPIVTVVCIGGLRTELAALAGGSFRRARP